ncbi:transcriptional regulator [cyanobacterium G8-9]|nr:transcriptional regulator [cyanobacterium G8-9]
MKKTTQKNQDLLDNLFITIGKNVKRKREEKGISQLELTHRMGFNSVSLVSQAEVYYNNQHFSIKHLYIIASTLECDLTDFFEGVEVEVIEWD